MHGNASLLQTPILLTIARRVDDSLILTLFLKHYTLTVADRLVRASCLCSVSW